MKENMTQIGLVQMGSWLLGEFGDMLIDGRCKNFDEEVIQETPDDLIELFECVLDEHDRKGRRSDVVISWVLTGLSKLYIRIPSMQKRINQIVDSYTDHANVEIQQRACEYLKIFNSDWDEEREMIFEAVPQQDEDNAAMTFDNDAKDRKVFDDDDDDLVQKKSSKETKRKQKENVQEQQQTVPDSGAALDLDDMLNTNSNPAPAQNQGSENLIDDLLNVFDGGNSN